MYLEMFNDFIEMGALEPLDAYITDADRENYLYLDKGFIKGKQYTMPFIVGNARILYFNMDILEQAGVTELPATWQDLVDVAVKIKEAGLPGVMPFAGEWADPAIGALNNLYYPYLWQAGGDIYNEDGTKVALMDNDAAVKPPGSCTTSSSNTACCRRNPWRWWAPRCATSSLRAISPSLPWTRNPARCSRTQASTGISSQPGGRDPRHMDRL